MDQLHLLWEYQKADVEVDKLEASIRRSPVRQKLVKYRDLYTEQQNAMKHIESEVAAMQDRLEALKDAIRMTNEQVHALHAKMEGEGPKSAADVQQFMNDAKRFQNKMTASVLVSSSAVKVPDTVNLFVESVVETNTMYAFFK